MLIWWEAKFNWKVGDNIRDKFLNAYDSRMVFPTYKNCLLTGSPPSKARLLNTRCVKSMGTWLRASRLGLLSPQGTLRDDPKLEHHGQWAWSLNTYDFWGKTSSTKNISVKYIHKLFSGESGTPDFIGSVVVNNPLIRPYFWGGGVALGGSP